jgi:hypothetical protein
MPMKNASYERYYAKNRETLTAKMKDRYDADKKHEYYEQHKEEVKANTKRRYEQLKAERKLAICNQILALNPPEHLRQKVEGLVGAGSPYLTTHGRTLDHLLRQAQQSVAVA